jgi:hypothetical protein
MRNAQGTFIAQGTDPDLIEVARWRARFEVGRGLSHGQGPDEVRREILSRFRDEMLAESFGAYTDEALMAAVQREIDEALDVSSS